jgi:hypothetical protein
MWECEHAQLAQGTVLKLLPPILTSDKQHYGAAWYCDLPLSSRVG